MSTPAEVVAMAASSVLGAPGEDQMPSKNKPSSESVALGPVSDAAVCNLGRLQAIGGEMEDIGMIPRGRSSANITHDVQVFQVVRGGRLEEMLALLKKHPLVWKTTDSDGCQPLHVAAEAGKLEMAQLLAQAGAQVTARDKDGWEPLHYACFHNHLGTAEWLLQAGADVSAASKDGWTPLHAAVDAGHVQLSRFLGSWRRSPGAHERRQRASPCGSGQRAPRARAVARSNDEGRKRVLAR